MSHLDSVTEAIAHFIGLFHITSEQARLRKDYDELQAARYADIQDAQDASGVSFKVNYALNDPDPELHYVPPWPEIVEIDTAFPLSHEPIPVPLFEELHLSPYDRSEVEGPPETSIKSSAPKTITSVGPELSEIPEIQPPGSVAVQIVQQSNLYDNDYVGVGGSDLMLQRISTPAPELDSLSDQAESAAPLLGASMPGSAEEIGTFIEEAAEAFKAIVQAVKDADMPAGQQSGAYEIQAFADEGETLDGIYVNGEKQDEAPDIQDYLPPGSILAMDEEPVETPQNDGLNGGGKQAFGASQSGAGALAQEASVELHAGGNTLVNNASLTNQTLYGHVTAVAGKHVELNAISQVNTWSDIDAVGKTASGWGTGAGTQTEAYNIAQFARTDLYEEPKATSDPLLPDQWAVSKIDGDLIFMNWIEQRNFVMDNDVHTMASSGAKTMVTSGGNTVFNDVSLAEYGSYYDLILVGGNFYDANIVSQTNVMFDNDVVGAVEGFETSGQTSLSTDGNLLWNQAAIANYGGAGRFSELPQAYKKTLDDLASGKSTIDDGVLSDLSFLGLAGLKVLYVAGNILDLQFIKQINVLGDADDVALAMNAAQAVADADWSVSTGSNVLVNMATIVDVDSTGKTYVGDGHYSNEFMVQTEIIRTDAFTSTADADALVNEAVAFLSDDMAGGEINNTDYGTSDNDGVHPAHTDVMQAVVT